MLLGVSMSYTRRLIRHKIRCIKGHYNLQGDHIVTLYDTSLQAAHEFGSIDFITLGVNQEAWKQLKEALGNPDPVKHPHMEGKYLKVFGDVYIRKATLAEFSDSVWNSTVQARYITMLPLRRFLESIIVHPKSVQKRIAVCESWLAKQREYNGYKP